MGLNKAGSNMYNWIAGTSNPLAGKCPHACSYCYVEDMKRFPELLKKYSGEPRLDLSAMYKKPKNGLNFLCSCNDLFAEAVPFDVLRFILEWARIQDCQWIIQTKNPERAWAHETLIPETALVGTTLETNRSFPEFSNAVYPVTRAFWLAKIRRERFVTIEPIMDFDILDMIDLVIAAKPSFVNIGADSKKHGLPEPSRVKVLALIEGITSAGIEIRRKSDLQRLLK